MKHKRNTSPARIASAKNAAVKREALKQYIRTSVIPSATNCLCNQCDVPIHREGCMNATQLARELNERGVASARGKVGTWQATMVINLFKNDVR